MVTIRAAGLDDAEAIWPLLEPVIRAGETYPLPRDMTREEVLAYWLAPQHEVFAAIMDGEVVGTYYIRANQRGGGSHICNCGYIAAASAAGKGVATAMCKHSLEYARTRDFRAMQFNFVISSNERAVRLWHRLGFETVGRLPRAFLHPKRGYVDAFVMMREL